VTPRDHVALDALVERALAGEPLSDAERAALAASPAHRAQIAELQRIQGELSRAAEREREGLFAEARAQEHWPGSRAFHARLDGLVTVRMRRRRVALAALLATAAAVLAFLWLRPSAPAPDPMDGVFVGEGGIRALAPQGTVPGFDRFEWDFELPAGGRFELRIWDAAAAEGTPPLVELELETTHWEPGPGRMLPRAVRWEVRAFGPTGLAAAARASAERR
jgi:hypothetical protein